VTGDAGLNFGSLYYAVLGGYYYSFLVEGLQLFRHFEAAEALENTRPDLAAKLKQMAKKL